MVKTYGLTHVGLAVRDPERSLAFYQAVFGVVAVHRHADFIQAQTPGSRDVLVFQQNEEGAGKTGGITHFGFRLTDPADIDAAEAAVLSAGGLVHNKGARVPGEPYIYFTDPDGYEVEVWYEPPTPIDPPDG
jgi:catechol 2,3-dioxygenase-like lactoylglutathione lyase family enzyme